MKINFRIKIYTTVISVFLLIGIASCEYLNVVPLETVDRDDMLQTQVDALKYLYGCYGPIQNDELIQYYHPFKLRQGSDEIVALAPQNADFQRYQWNQPNGTSTYGGAFQTYYSAIGYCNQFIRDINEYKIEGLNSNDKAQYIAEAKFIKAYLHSELMKYYGPIPIVDEILSMNVAISELPGRSHFDYCTDYVAKLCDEAYEDLPITYTNSMYYGRATKAAAKFLKAKVRWLAASPLFNGDFPDRSWKNEGYETPGYGTELVSHTYDPNKWEIARQACLEAIQEAETAGHKLFDIADSEVRRAADRIPLPQIPGIDTGTPEGEEFAKRVMLMRYVPVVGPDQGSTEAVWGMLNIAPAMDYSSLPHYIITDQNGIRRGGWGFISPTLYTVEHFYTIDGKLPADDTKFPPESQWFQSSGIRLQNDDSSQNTPEIINLCVGREPRFYAWIGFDGDEYSPVIKNGKQLILRMRESTENGYDPNFGANNQSQTGFLNKKFIHPNIRYTGIDSNNNLGEASNHPTALFRLPDLYLMLAEACGRLDNYLDEGTHYLNLVRKRAGIPAIDVADVSSNGELLKIVRNEWFVEYYYEAHRQIDIRRNVEGAKYMSKSCYRSLDAVKQNPSFEEFNTPIVIEQPFNWNERMYLYPIINSEVYSDPQLVQAPGY